MHLTSDGGVVPDKRDYASIIMKSKVRIDLV